MKFLLCRPRGGLNDALGTIENCWLYSMVHNRTLIIDTEYLVSTGIAIQFSKLFKTINKENVILDLSQKLLEELNQLSVFPEPLKGKLNSYETKWVEEYRNLADKETNVKLSFDFNHNYLEDLLVHDQFGGNGNGIRGLARFKLTDKFRGDVLSLLSPLIGKKHNAVHIRHTDYRTNYRRCFEEIHKRVANQRLLICTDSIEVVNYAKSFLNQSEIFTLSLPPDTHGVGLPTFATYHSDHHQKYTLMVEAFADLIGIATAQETFFSRLTPGEFSDAASHYTDFNNFSELVKKNQGIGINGYSGFAVLGSCLRDNPLVINQLLTP